MNNSLVCEQALPERCDGGARKRFPSPLSHPAPPEVPGELARRLIKAGTAASHFA